MDSQNDGKVRLNHLLDQIVGGIPEFIGALLIFFIGYFVAKALEKVVQSLLGRAQFDQRLHAGSGGNVLQRAVPSPTTLVGRIVFWVVFLFAISIAVSVLGIPILVQIVQGIYSYIPNVIAAVLIFLVASAVSAAVATLATRTMGETPTGKVLATVGPVLVMGIAVFMILNQLKIAPAIVTITYTALIGGAALAMALAFGLGGREVAARMLEDLYRKGQQNKGRVSADMRKGADTAREKGSRAADNL
jgi:hypothetical protein